MRCTWCAVAGRSPCASIRAYSFSKCSGWMRSIRCAPSPGVLRRLEHFSELTGKAGDVNRRLLQTMHAGQGCVLASPAIERVAQPTLTEDGRRAPALRFGEPRVMALAGALSLTLFGACGITNKSLRALTARLLDTPYSPSQMTYDLRRLRLNGLIRRIAHTHTYVLTPDGQRLAIFYT